MEKKPGKNLQEIYGYVLYIFFSIIYSTPRWSLMSIAYRVITEIEKMIGVIELIAHNCTYTLNNVIYTNSFFLKKA